MDPKICPRPGSQDLHRLALSFSQGPNFGRPLAPVKDCERGTCAGVLSSRTSEGVSKPAAQNQARIELDAHVGVLPLLV